MTDFELGRHEAQIQALSERAESTERMVHGIDKKVDEIRLTLAERKGERRTIAILATAAGGAGSLLVTFLLSLWKHS